MKKLGLLLICLIVMTSMSCHKKKIPHYPLSAALKAAFGYKIGSYWVYRDSVSGEIDSFYTYKSNFSTDDEGDALVDRFDITLKGYKNNSVDSEIWSILLIDSSFCINFINPKLDKPEPKREKSVIFQQILVCGTSDLPLCV